MIGYLCQVCHRWVWIAEAFTRPPCQHCLKDTHP